MVARVFTDEYSAPMVQTPSESPTSECKRLRHFRSKPLQLVWFLKGLCWCIKWSNIKLNNMGSWVHSRDLLCSQVYNKKKMLSEDTR